MDLDARVDENYKRTDLWTDGRADGWKTGRPYRTLQKQVRQKRHILDIRKPFTTCGSATFEHKYMCMSICDVHQEITSSLTCIRYLLLISCTYMHENLQKFKD